jgi:nitroreductase
MASLDDAALDQLFRAARSVHAFNGDPVTDATLRRLYDLLKWGPTAFNTQPARYVFVRSDEAKRRLAPALSNSNRDKTLSAPATVIVAYDTRFYELLPRQFPDANLLDLFSTDYQLVQTTAFRNGTLQGAYLLIAARALGLAVGPMSGFDPEAVNREFFPDGRYRANFLANMGYGAAASGRPRGPRLEFAEVAQLL